MQHEDKQVINGKMIYRAYLICPYCRKEYTISYDTDKTFSKKKQIHKMFVDLQNENNPNQFERKQRKLNKMKQRLESEILILKQKYAKHFETEGEKHGRTEQ